MKSLESFTYNLSAASPVIGVMLMVVVTVILAAAVAAYTNGILTNTDPAPSAAFDIEMRKDVPVNLGSELGNMSYIAITQITGDTIPTDELLIKTINPNARGNQTRTILPNVNNTYTASFRGTSPFWNKGNFPVTGQFFGEFVMEPGMTMVADEYSNYVGATWDEAANDYITDPDGHMTGMQAMFADWGDNPEDPSDDTVHAGDIVTIKIIHSPTNTVLYSKDVVVSE